MPLAQLFEPNATSRCERHERADGFAGRPSSGGHRVDRGLSEHHLAFSFSFSHLFTKQRHEERQISTSPGGPEGVLSQHEEHDALETSLKPQLRSSLRFNSLEFGGSL